MKTPYPKQGLGFPLLFLLYVRIHGEREIGSVFFNPLQNFLIGRIKKKTKNSSFIFSLEIARGWRRGT
jgi:hypothetical protein